MRVGRSLQSSLITQAAITALFSLTVLARPGWLLLELVLAAGCGAVAWFAGQGGARVREVVTGFELLAVALGVLAFLAGHYVPGTIMAIFTLVGLHGSRSGGAPAGPVLPPPQAAPAVPPYAAPAAPTPPAPAAFPPPPAPGPGAGGGAITILPSL